MMEKMSVYINESNFDKKLSDEWLETLKNDVWR